MPPTFPVPAPVPADPLTGLTKGLHEALLAVNVTKAAAEKAQAALDAARSDWEAAVTAARELHADFQRAVTAIVPGVKI